MGSETSKEEQIKLLEEQGELFRSAEDIIREVTLIEELYNLIQQPNGFEIVQRRRAIIKELYELKFGSDNASKNAS